MKTSIDNPLTDTKTQNGVTYKRSILHRRYVRSLRRASHGLGG